MRRTIPIAGVLLALVLISAACAGGDDAAYYDAGEYAATTTAVSATTMADRDAVAGAEAPPGDQQEGAADDGGVNAVPAVATIDPADLGRLIVYTATIRVEVDDVLAAAAEVQTAVAGLGGILFGQETVTGDEPYSVLTIKVPPDNFQEALRRLAGVGKLLGQSVFADDVTERVVDLQSQITTAEASVERLRTFLENATDLETVALLEGQLLERETQLEVLRGRLRTLEDQVSLATITLTLTEPVPPVPEPALDLIETGYAGHDGGAGCPGAEELRIDEGADYTVCILVTNVGDTLLTDIEVRDPGLRADQDDFVLVSGSLDTPLPPDGTLVFAFEGKGDPRYRWTDPVAQATAVDEDGDPLRTTVYLTVQPLALHVDADDSLPGFMDGLLAAWHGLQRIFGVIVVATGALIPFLWVPVLLLAAVWFARRRRTAAASDEDGAGTEG